MSLPAAGAEIKQATMHVEAAIRVISGRGFNSPRLHWAQLRSLPQRATGCGVVVFCGLYIPGRFLLGSARFCFLLPRCLRRVPVHSGCPVEPFIRDAVGVMLAAHGDAVADRLAARVLREGRRPLLLPRRSQRLEPFASFGRRAADSPRVPPLPTVASSLAVLSAVGRRRRAWLDSRTTPEGV